MREEELKLKGEGRGGGRINEVREKVLLPRRILSVTKSIVDLQCIDFGCFVCSFVSDIVSCNCGY